MSKNSIQQAVVNQLSQPLANPLKASLWKEVIPGETFPATNITPIQDKKIDNAIRKKIISQC
jgi:hypothetical protein